MNRKTLVAIALASVAIFAAGLWLLRNRAASRPAEAEPPGRAQAGSTAGSGDEKRSAATLMAVAATASPTVQAVVDPRRDYPERVAAIAEITTNMPPADWQALQEFLLLKDRADADQLGQVFKNKLMDLLCALNPPPADLEKLLVRVYRDRDQDPVIRDYAVQHLAAYYEQMEVAGLDDVQAQQMIQDALWEALAETDSSIAGTALLALERLSRERAQFDRKKVAASALKLAADGGAGELTRISAFQMCGQMAVSDAGGVLLDAVQNAQTMPLRISAIGALGTLGDVRALPLLTGILNGEEERLKPPAQRALMEIQRQEEQKAGRTNI
jgi:hypothetical protein